MTLGFSVHTSSTRLAILLNEVTHTRPSILALDKTNSLILTGVSSKYVVMLMAEDSEMEVGGVGNVDTSIVEKITCIVNRPAGIRILQEGKVSGVGRKSGEDSEWSCSVSMMTVAFRAGVRSSVARSEAESCSWLKTGRKLFGLTDE